MRFLLPILFAAALPLQASDLWFHLRVDDRSERQTKVVVNLPYSVVQTVLPAIEKSRPREERPHIRLNDHDVSPAELRNALNALRANPAAAVTIKSDDSTCVLTTAAENLVIRTQDPHGENIEVRTPFDLAAALVSSKDDDVNFEAAVQTLIRRGRGELLQVVGDEATVRVWIDDRP